MKPAWDALSTEYADHARVVVADVDCTVHQDLCGEHGVQGYPTIKYYLGGNAEDYEGGRDADSLKKFVEETLMSSACDSNNKESCDPADLVELENAMALSADERAKIIADGKEAMADAQKAHEKLVEGLQAQFEKSQKDSEAVTAETKKALKWVKAVKEPKTKDEL